MILLDSSQAQRGPKSYLTCLLIGGSSSLRYIPLFYWSSFVYLQFIQARNKCWNLSVESLRDVIMSRQGSWILNDSFRVEASTRKKSSVVSIRVQELGHTVLTCLSDLDNYFSWPVNESDELVQVVLFTEVLCNVMSMLSRRATSLILELVRIVIRSSFIIQTGTLGAEQNAILNEIPLNPGTILISTACR